MIVSGIGYKLSSRIFRLHEPEEMKEKKINERPVNVNLSSLVILTRRQVYARGCRVETSFRNSPLRRIRNHRRISSCISPPWPELAAPWPRASTRIAWLKPSSESSPYPRNRHLLHRGRRSRARRDRTKVREREEIGTRELHRQTEGGNIGAVNADDATDDRRPAHAKLRLDVYVLSVCVCYATLDAEQKRAAR